MRPQHPHDQSEAFSLSVCQRKINLVSSKWSESRRAAASPEPVEPDKSSLWMDLFSLDSVILIIVICYCLPFSSSRSWAPVEVYFSETYFMTSAENSISEPPNLKIFLEEDTPRPPTRLVPSALAIMPLVTKNLTTALGNAKKNKLCHSEIPFKSRERKRRPNLQTFVFHSLSARAFLHQLSSKHRQHRDP